MTSTSLLSNQRTRVADVRLIRSIEAACFAQTPSYEVMQAAAAACVAYVNDFPAPVLCVAGPGSNGGDALAVARLLHTQGKRTMAWLPLGEPAAPSDAAQALAALRAVGGEVLTNEPSWPEVGSVVDGLFGIGINRDLSDKAAAVVTQVNQLAKPVLAIDVPSGIDGDHGCVCGVAVRATRTVTFFCHKPGLLTGAGKEYAGDVSVADLDQVEHIGNKGGLCIDGVFGVETLRRRENAHKGSHGTLAVVGGATGMVGALALASRVAVAHGTGKVFAVSLDSRAPAFDSCAPEVMWRANLPSHLTAIAFGIGAGTSMGAANRLSVCLQRALPLVIDADGLNLLAAHAWLRKELGAHVQPCVCTPHPAEAGRLLGVSTREVLLDRRAAGLELAQRLNTVVILKGSGTYVAAKNGRWGMVAAGNPGLAQAGSGDVLTGIIAALLAQGCGAWDAAVSGTWLHAAAADVVCAEHGGPLGIPLAEVCKASSRLLVAALT